ncbi:hypothetical protein BGW42_004558 [Actinomortierella wolfii]|nr:hypothetical protein BGW42_004558 [Actinomortierella wolfii]
MARRIAKGVTRSRAVPDFPTADLDEQPSTHADAVSTRTSSTISSFISDNRAHGIVDGTTHSTIDNTLCNVVTRVSTDSAEDSVMHKQQRAVTHEHLRIEESPVADDLALQLVQAGVEHYRAVVSKVAAAIVSTKTEQDKVSLQRQQRRLQSQLQDSINALKTLQSVLKETDSVLSVRKENTSFTTATSTEAIKSEYTLETDPSYPRYRRGNNALEFLDDLHMHVSVKTDWRFFFQNAYHFIVMKVYDEQIVSRFKAEMQRCKDEFDAAKKSSLDPIPWKNWEECKGAFVKATISDEERYNRVNKLVYGGRRDRESWRKYAQRLERDMKLFGRRCEADLFVPLLSEQNVDIINVMLMDYRLRKQDYELLAFKSFDEFVCSLERMYGPDFDQNEPKGRKKRGKLTSDTRGTQSVRGRSHRKPAKRRQCDQRHCDLFLP